MNEEIQHVSEAYQSWRHRTRRGTHLPPDLKKAIINLTHRYEITELSRQMNIPVHSLKR